jgi:hypothetical protein
LKSWCQSPTENPLRLFKHLNFEIETISLANYQEREIEIRRLFAKNLNALFRGNQVQKETSFQMA